MRTMSDKKDITEVVGEQEVCVLFEPYIFLKISHFVGSSVQVAIQPAPVGFERQENRSCFRGMKHVVTIQCRKERLCVLRIL